MKIFKHFILLLILAFSISTCSGNKKTIKPVAPVTAAKVESPVVTRKAERQESSLVVRVLIENVHRIKDDLFEIECKILDVKKTKTKATLSADDIVILKPGFEYSGKKIANTQQNRDLLALREFPVGGFIRMKIDYIDSGWTIIEVLK